MTGTSFSLISHLEGCELGSNQITIAIYGKIEPRHLVYKNKHENCTYMLGLLKCDK